MGVIVQFVDHDGNDVDEYYVKPGKKVPADLMDVEFQKTWWGGRKAVFTFQFSPTTSKGGDA